MVRDLVKITVKPGHFKKGKGRRFSQDGFEGGIGKYFRILKHDVHRGKTGKLIEYEIAEDGTYAILTLELS